MSFYVYLPPVFSLWFLALSAVIGGYLKQLVGGMAANDQNVQQNQTIIRSVASDWSARISFFNSMWMAFPSCISIFATTKDYTRVAVVLIALLIIFSFMFYWIISFPPGMLVVTRTRFLNLVAATWCRIILVVVNLLLIGTIATR